MYPPKELVFKVKLVRVHHNMSADLKSKINEEGFVRQKHQTTGEYLVNFGEDSLYNSFWIKPKYLELK